MGPRGGATCAARPEDLDRAAWIGVGNVLGKLGTRTTVDIWVGGALNGTVSVDLTNYRVDSGGSSDRIAFVDCPVDGDLGNVTVGRNESRKEKRKDCESDHDAILDW